MNKNLIIDNPVVSNIIFYPRKTPIPQNLPENIKVLKFKLDDKIEIGGIFYQNSMTFPTILLFHGNGEVALDYMHFYQLFFECSVNLAVIDFRGYGFSTGTPYYTSLLTDAMPIYKKFIEWMKNNGLNDSIFVQGRSLGSACASEIGSHKPESLKGIIFESGFASIFNMMTRLFRVSSPELTPLFLQKFSNDTRLHDFDTPVLIIHGSSDWIIPLSEAHLIFQNLPDRVEKKLVIIEGAGHNDIFYYKTEYFSALKVFIKRFQ
jgi:pimeloyl-ACP methyl ester carboxylesterase